jgi:hypothetical protein
MQAMQGEINLELLTEVSSHAGRHVLPNDPLFASRETLNFQHHRCENLKTRAHCAYFT